MIARLAVEVRVPRACYDALGDSHAIQAMLRQTGVWSPAGGRSAVAGRCGDVWLHRQLYGAASRTGGARMTDVRFKTMRHIETVRNYLSACIHELLIRQEQHDQSKLESPEVEAYEAITQQLRGLTYGSDAYRAVLRSQAPAIAHHYACNRHHPEFFLRAFRG